MLFRSGAGNRRLCQCCDEEISPTNHYSFYLNVVFRLQLLSMTVRRDPEGQLKHVEPSIFKKKNLATVCTRLEAKKNCAILVGPT